jgi:hypothetical protein
MSRFGQVALEPLDKKNPENAEILREQKTLKLKDKEGRDVSVGSKVMLPNPKVEGQVAFLDGEDVIVRLAPPHRKGPANEVLCLSKCGRKPKAPAKPKTPKVRFAEPSEEKPARGKSRKNKKNTVNNERMAFLLKALNLHNQSRRKSRAPPSENKKSRAKSVKPSKSRINEND